MSIQLTRIEEFALITIDRPQALNALSFALIADLGAAIDEVAGTDARALLITGSGPKAFCAGADIKELTGRSMQAQHDGALFGQTPEEAFYVKCDDETNPRYLIDAGQVNVQIGICPVKPAEFVILTIQQIAGDLQ